jgi:hypothetical protein
LPRYNAWARKILHDTIGGRRPEVLEEESKKILGIKNGK